MLHEIQVLLAKNVLARVPVSTRSCVILCEHVSSPKAKWDLSTDSQRLNVYIECPHFKMETI